MHYKIKRFSKSGKIWAGTKQAIRTGAKGAFWGGVLAPGNGIAYMTGHKKVAAGLTGAGALIGAGIGAKLGYNSGVTEYRLKNDPEYKIELQKKNLEDLKKNLKPSKDSDLASVKEFDYLSWKKFLEGIDNTPKEFLSYIKFYKDIWSKNIDKWYSSMDLDSLAEFNYGFVPEFKEFFPIPIPSNVSKDWSVEDEEDICLATYNNVGDDGFLYYRPKYKEYYIDYAPEGKGSSLEKILTVKVDYEKEYLSKDQLNLISEFNRRIKSLR